MIIIFAIRQFASWASTVITHKHSPERKQGEKKRKDIYLLVKNSFLCLLLAYHRSTSLAVLVPLFFLITYPVTLTYKRLLCVHTPSPRHGCGATIPPWPLRVSWRSLSWSLKRDTLREMVLLFVVLLQVNSRRRLTMLRFWESPIYLQ